MYFFDSSILFHKNLFPIHNIQSFQQPIDALTLEVEDSSFIFKFFNFYIFHDSICSFLREERIWIEVGTLVFQLASR